MSTRPTLAGVRVTAGLVTTLVGFAAPGLAAEPPPPAPPEQPFELTRRIYRDAAGRKQGWCARLCPLPARPESVGAMRAALRALGWGRR